MSIKRDVEFLFEVGCMRYVDRVWRQFHMPEAANVGEHLFRVAWIALTLARYEGKGNHEKILKMAITHDLSESRTGDANYLSRQYVERYEYRAVTDMFENTAHSEMVVLMKEYEARESFEAKVVKDADNLDVELELREFASRGHTTPALWKKRRAENVRPKLFTASAKKFWDAIATANPHDWHSKSKSNRHNSGDWKKNAKNKEN